MKRIRTYLTGCLLLTIALKLYGQSNMVESETLLYQQVERETFSIAVVIKGGTANYAKAEEGIEYLALTWATKGGILGIKPKEIAKEMDSLGMNIEVESTLDYSTVIITGLKKYWKRSFEIFSLMIENPALDENVFEDVKEELAFYAFFNQQDPEYQIFQVSISNLFKGSDYEKIPEGSPQSIKEFKKNTVSDYLIKLTSDMNGFLTVVGDFTEAELGIMRRFSSSLFSGTKAESPREIVEIPQRPSLNNQSISTNYLRGTITSPSLSTNDGIPMLLGMEILSNRIFQKIRSEEGLSYAPQAYYAMGVIQNPYSVILIDTDKPNSVLKHLSELIQTIISDEISEKELERQKIQHLTEKYLSQETTLLICNDLFISGLQNLVLTVSEYNERINSVKTEEINTVLSKYLKRIYWTYLGNTELVNEKLLLESSNIGG